jgi:DNA-binding winged helix-turn-helix (wHTH) protein/TolB-like protein
LDDRQEGAESSYRFGPYQLVPHQRLLALGDVGIPLAPKLFDLLLLLVRESGRVVTRERIAEAIWPDVFVSETNLRQKVWLLRKALKAGDCEPVEYIETVPRRGYRFTAPVVEVAVPAPIIPPPLPTKPVLPDALPRARPWLRNLVGLLNIVLMTVALSSDRTTAYRMPGLAASASPGDTRRSVALLRLRSHSGDPQDGWIADAFTEMLRAELATSTGFRLVPAETVQLLHDLSPPPAMTLSAQSLSRVRHMLGGEWVVAGALVAAGAGEDAGLRVDLLVQCTKSREIIGSVTQSGTRRELNQLASRAGHDLRTALGAARARQP